MTAQRSIAGQCWNNEEWSFKRQVTAEANAANEAQDRELAKLREQPQSAEEYDLWVSSIYYTSF